MMPLRQLIFLLWFTAVGGFISCKNVKDYYPDPDPQVQRRVEAWQDLKFGLLMHWGPYSQWGVSESWSICPEDLSWASGSRKQGISDDYFSYVQQYEALQKTFNPQKFDPAKWAAAASDAGMKYMVFTTKHHDGFCMFDSKYTNYKITDSTCPFLNNSKRNITAEIFAAFRQQNFWIGAYFSKPDWHSNDYWWKHFPAVDRNPNYAIEKHPERWKNFVDFTHKQINEVVSDYGKIDILWLDGSWVRPKIPADVQYEIAERYEGSRWSRNPQSQDIDMPGLAKEVRQKNPQLLIVDRGVKGIYQNYLTPEQHIPDQPIPHPWETCMTMGDSWSYKPNDRYKPANEIIGNLIDVVSKGGNYLLNVGPDANGEFDSAVYNRLKEIGIWMKTNGEAIYGTKVYKKFGEGDSVRYTQNKRGDVRYIFFLHPSINSYRLREIDFSENVRLQWLNNPAAPVLIKKGDRVEVTIPKDATAQKGLPIVLRISNQ